MVGNELQRYNGEQRGKEVVNLRYWNTDIAFFGNVIAFFMDEDDFGTTCTAFVDG
jgi:hypothetical protein